MIESTFSGPSLRNSPSPGPGAMPAPAYPDRLVEQARLADGTLVTLRPLRAGDLELHRAFVCALSAQTRYARLLSARKLAPGELRRMTDIDYDRQMALVAVAERDGIEQELGVARYVRDCAGSAEFALVVGDAWQGRGLGETLLRALLHAAVDAGLESIGGITLSGNLHMLRLARRLGFSARRDPLDAGVMQLHQALAPGRSAGRLEPHAEAR